MPISHLPANVDAVSEISLERGQQGWFSIVIPEERTNLDTNPSYETGITGVTNVGGATSAKSSTDQRRGTYSCAITMGAGTTDGIYKSYSLAAATQYFASCDVKAPAGMPMQLLFTDNAGTTVYGRKQWIASGQWERVECNGLTVTATTYRVYLQKNTSAKTGTVYTDGWQVEAGAYSTTYLDGDMVGVVPNRVDFWWSGTPHSSISTRHGQCRIGGRVRNLREFGFYLTNIIGGGFSGQENKSSSLSTDGDFYQGSVLRGRTFSIVGDMYGTSYSQIQRNVANLIGYMQAHYVTPDQPILLRYQELDECDAAIGEVIEMQVVYSDGLGGTRENFFQNKLALSFQIYTPYIGTMEGNTASTLQYQVSLTSADYLFANIDGVWQKLGTGVAGASAVVRAVAIADDGTIYITGTFTSVNGVSANNIAKYSRGAWSAMGTGLSAQGLALTINPATQQVYVAGSFITANAVTVNYVTYWNGTTFVALGGTPGLNAYGADLVFGKDGHLYVVGNFTTAGGSAANYVAKWDGSAWSALGAGAASTKLGIEVGPDGKIWTAATVEYWDGTTWTNAGADASIQGTSLFASKSGVIYGVGDPLPTNGQPLLFWFSGGAWQSKLIDTFSPTTVYGLELTEDRFGNVIISLAINSAGSWVPVDYIFTPGPNIINKYDWYGASITYSAGTLGNYSSSYKNGTYVVVGNRTGNVTAAGLTSVTNPTKQDIFPTFTFTGPGTLYSLRSYTTGLAIYFNNLTLLAGETAYLDLTPTNITFRSNIRGSMVNYLKTGSSLGFWKLIPGVNKVAVFIGGTTSGATASSLTMKKTALALTQAII